MNRNRKLFVNLPVRRLRRSVEFFGALGFEFDARFTDDHATCMILGADACAMLLEEARFRDFTRREICDTSSHTEALLAISCESREEVDALVQAAVDHGGKHAMDAEDHGFMYGWSFYDPDGHHWEVFWMDPEAVPSQDAQA
jgi:predicted lactoylglutathione lyase